jgi:hypothetical protein
MRSWFTKGNVVFAAGNAVYFLFDKHTLDSLLAIGVAGASAAYLGFTKSRA